METWDAIRARRNVRSFTDRPVAEADLERILDAGRRAPSARNLQPWNFVVVTDRTELQELAKVWQSAGHIAGSAATVVLVLRDPADERRAMLDQFDLGQATLAMAVTAADLGIGSGHASVGAQDLARRLLGLPDGHYAAYLLAFGYPADRPLAPIRRPARRPLEDVVHRGRW